MSALRGQSAPPISLGASPALRARKIRGRIAHALFLAATLLAVSVLGVLLWSVFQRGWSWLDWGLLRQMPSRKPESAGLQSALMGTIWVISLTALIAVPVGVGAAIYLEEYAPRNRWTRLLQINIANLAGVPSVVYGLLGLGAFVQVMQLGRSVIAAALTLALLILPVIIIASREALRAVPSSLRQAAYALGATRWQVTWSHVLPAALPGILTGTILAISRAIGETAPLLVVGASGYIAFNPTGVSDSFTVLPIQIYAWMARPQTDFRDLAAAGIIVLLVVLLTMNATTIFIRQRLNRRPRW